MSIVSKVFQKNTVVLAAILILAISVITGCTSAPVSDLNQTMDQNNQLVDQNQPINDANKDQNVAQIEDNNSLETGTKTGTEQIEEAIELAVANGTYEDQLTYAYHSGTETVDVRVTVQDDVITEATVTSDTTTPTSKRLIEGVNAALPELVVGKKITEVEIPANVAGSSLTTAAFKGYLENLIEKN